MAKTWSPPKVTVRDNNREDSPYDIRSIWASCGPYACHSQGKWPTGHHFWGFRDATDDYLDYMNPSEVPPPMAEAMISALLAYFKEGS